MRKPDSKFIRALSIQSILEIQTSLKTIYNELGKVNSILGTSISTPEIVISTISEVFRIDMLKANPKTNRLSHSRDASKVRHITRYLLTRCTNLNYDEIAKITGVKEHSVVSHSIKTTKDLVDTDSQIRNQIDYCIFKISTK